MMQERIDALVDALAAEKGSGDFHREGEGWSGAIGGLCPTQGDGLVDGHAWYFRARGASWEMVIAEPLGVEVDACDVYLGGIPGWFTCGSWGTAPEGSGQGALKVAKVSAARLSSD